MRRIFFLAKSIERGYLHVMNAIATLEKQIANLKEDIAEYRNSGTEAQLSCQQRIATLARCYDKIALLREQSGE